MASFYRTNFLQPDCLLRWGPRKLQLDLFDYSVTGKRIVFEEFIGPRTQITIAKGL